MPRPVSDAIADGLPLWDTYEALFFLSTGILLGLILGFLFPSLWRSFRRRFRRLDRYKPSDGGGVSLLLNSKLKILTSTGLQSEGEESSEEFDLSGLFVSARCAVQENSLREAASIYLQILSSEKVSRVQTNKAMFELAQVYALSGLASKAFETGFELLHRKPAHVDVFRFLLSLLAKSAGEEGQLEPLLETYTGPASGDLAREVAHILSESSANVLKRKELEKRPLAIRLAKQAVRWSPTSFEPKLRLIEATSVLWQERDGQPSDQLLMGFCVDLMELSRLRSAFSTIPERAFESFLDAWRVRLDAQSSELLDVIPKMSAEIRSQLKFQPTQDESVKSPDLSFIWGILTRLQQDSPAFRLSSGAGGTSHWFNVLRDVCGAEPEFRLVAALFACQSCSELYRDHHWQCRHCGRWEVISEWSPKALNPANGRPASQ